MPGGYLVVPWFIAAHRCFWRTQCGIGAVSGGHVCAFVAPSLAWVPRRWWRLRWCSAGIHHGFAKIISTFDPLTRGEFGVSGVAMDGYGWVVKYPEWATLGGGGARNALR